MMVDYLCRQGIVVPSRRWAPGRGRPRLYGFGDLILLRAVNRLLSSGLPVSRLKVPLRKLQRHFRDLSPETAIERYLMTDGREAFFADEPGAFVDLAEDGQLGFAFIIDVERARRDVLRAVARQTGGPEAA